MGIHYPHGQAREGEIIRGLNDSSYTPTLHRYKKGQSNKYTAPLHIGAKRNNALHTRLIKDFWLILEREMNRNLASYRSSALR